MDLMTWTLFKEQRPKPAPDLYWWRVAPRTYGGLELRPEFARLFSRHYDDARNQDVWLPDNFTSWSGWRWEYPTTLEWALKEDGDEARDERWPGVNLKPCPFCGDGVKIISRQASLVGGAYNGLFSGGKCYLHNWFRLHHTCAAISTRGFGADLAGMIERWNRRQEAV
jgi:hypothetical protein